MPPIKTPALLPDLQKFVATLGADVPYDKLLSTAAEAGWSYRLVQREVQFAPHAGSYLVSFDVQIGRDGTFDLFDTVSVALRPEHVGPAMPVSLAARFHIVPTLIYMFFGRLPPQVPASPPKADPERTVDLSGADTGDIVLDLDDPTPADEAEDRGFVDALEIETPFTRKPVTKENLNIVDHLEPDGVPIFADLYEIGGPEVTADEIVDEIMKVTKAFTIKVDSIEQLSAFYTKNTDLEQFLKDMATGEQRAEFKTHLDRAMERLRTPEREVKIPQTRRRRAA